MPLFPNSSGQSFHQGFALGWWITTIQLRSLENKVRMFSPSGSGPCSPINWSVFSTAAIVHFWHVVDGLYMYVSLPGLGALASSIYVTIKWRTSDSWEFFTNLDYEWDAIRGRRPYRWTIWVCSLLSGFVIAHSRTED